MQKKIYDNIFVGEADIMMYANVTNTMDPDACEYQNVATKEEPQQPVDTGRVISLPFVILLAIWSSLFGII